MKHYYKPGQFVSIGGKLARVCKNADFRTTCTVCIETNHRMPCREANRGIIPRICHATECYNKLGNYLFPKLIKQ